jgi:ATP-dependent Lon protease
MADHITIPLFPLQLVVFPGQLVPLYIFEDRYKLLFAEVSAARERVEDLYVGVVLAEGSEVRDEVGCAVMLEEILTEHPDGRLNIITLAVRRFRIKQIIEAKPYSEAVVEYFDDDEEHIDSILQTRVWASYRRLLELVEEETGVAPEVGEGDNAFQVAQAVSLDLQAKQRLLAITTENARLDLLDGYFAQLIPGLEERSAQRRRVRSNGHS